MTQEQAEIVNNLVRKKFNREEFPYMVGHIPETTENSPIAGHVAVMLFTKEYREKQMQEIKEFGLKDALQKPNNHPIVKEAVLYIHSDGWLRIGTPNLEVALALINSLEPSQIWDSTMVTG
jgi:hypothetical protein